MLVPTLSLHDYRLRLKPGIPRRLNRIPYTEIILYIQDHPFKTKSEEPFKISVCAFAPSIQDDVTLETSYREHPLYQSPMYRRDLLAVNLLRVAWRRVASRCVALRRVASRCAGSRCVALRRIKQWPLDTCTRIYRTSVFHYVIGHCTAQILPRRDGVMPLGVVQHIERRSSRQTPASVQPLLVW
jgi:hypothetical protein